MDRSERAWEIAGQAQPGPTDAELDEVVQMGLEIADEAHKVVQMHPLAHAGPLTLHNRGISFAVDEDGRVLRYPDGEPVDGAATRDMVNSSGRRLTNAQAAGQIITTHAFVGRVRAILGKPEPGGEDKEK